MDGDDGRTTGGAVDVSDSDCHDVLINRQACNSLLEVGFIY